MKIYLNTEWKEVDINGGKQNIPKDWECKNLDSLGKLNRGKSKHRPRNDPKLFGNKYPFIQTAEVKEAKLWLTNKPQKYYSEFGLKQSKLWDEGTLCITIAANIAESSILTYKACFPDSVLGFIPNENINTVFIKYQIDILKSKMKNSSKGSAQDNLNLDKINLFKLPIPKFEEQKNIVSVLLSQESIVQKTKDLIANIEKRNQFMMDELLSGRLRVKEENGQTVFYKNPDENWNEVKINGEDINIPKDWDSFKLEKHITCNMGETILSANVKQSSFANAIPVISASQDEKYFGYIDKKIVKKVLSKGDLTICARGSIGFPRIVKEDVASTQTTIQVRSNKLDLNYICHFLNTNHEKFFNSTGGAVPQLTLGMLNNFEIIQPKNKIEMEKILNVINSLTTEKQKYERILKKEEKTFTFLLEELMSGRLRVKI